MSQYIITVTSKKGLKVWRNEESNDTDTFASPDEAKKALDEWSTAAYFKSFGHRYFLQELKLVEEL